MPMFKCFEYIQLRYDGTLEDFCALGSTGWEIVAVVPDGSRFTFILKREIAEPESILKTKEFYRNRKREAGGPDAE